MSEERKLKLVLTEDGALTNNPKRQLMESRSKSVTLKINVPIFSFEETPHY